MSNHKEDQEHAAPLLDQRRESGDPRDSDIELADFDDYEDGLPSDSSQATPPSPTLTAKTTKTSRSYLAIGITLITAVISFTVNTESTAYFEDVLGWKKPFCTMYLMHSALSLPWLCQLGWSRIKNRDVPYRIWVRDYNNQLREVIATIDAYATSGTSMVWKRKGQVGGPLDFLATTMVLVTAVLTVSGCSWFLALVMTTPADLTAIYNCSTIFAAAFSVPLLKEKLGWIGIVAVVLSVAGTFTIAYGDSMAKHEESKIGSSRLLGNLVASVGAVAFGLYEVLFKKWACSSQPMSPSESLPLTFAASALTGFYTFGSLWIGLVILHFTGVEEFVWPSADVGLWIAVSVLSGSIYINLLAVLVIWTSPVFGSMANVLSVFLVALADWVIFSLKPSIATYVGGVLIIVAFGLLAKDTLGEKKH